MSEKIDIQTKRNRTIKQLDDEKLLSDFDVDELDRLGSAVPNRAKPGSFKSLPVRPKSPAAVSRHPRNQRS